ncbi:MAG: Rpn family recombination-promoting nuclease/putative transposase [Magnetococcales bacterium]|nr:Rpn family recombination-promoting nuclease/putative transposase [Magnetococcales bacterium]
MTDISQPHDRFLKILLANPHTAGTLLRERLPEEVTRFFSTEPPELVEGSFIDGEFRKHLTDRLFRVKCLDGRSAFVYTLIEHKSHPDGWIAFQLLRYVVRILEQLDREREKGTLLPPIVPLVVYHGVEAWQTPTRFSALMEGDEALKPHLIDLPFSVVDLGQIDDVALSGDDRLRGGFLTLKYVFHQAHQPQVATKIARLIRTDSELAERVFVYMIQTYGALDMSDVQELTEELFPGKAEQYESIWAKKMIAKGRQEGRQEGRMEERVDLLLFQLEEKFGPLPAWVRESVASADIASLKEWSRRVLKEDSLEKLFAP